MLIQSLFWDPSRTACLRGFTHFVTFVDDYFRVTKVVQNYFILFGLFVLK